AEGVEAVIDSTLDGAAQGAAGKSPVERKRRPVAIDRGDIALAYCAAKMRQFAAKPRQHFAGVESFSPDTAAKESSSQERGPESTSGPNSYVLRGLEDAPV